MIWLVFLAASAAAFLQPTSDRVGSCEPPLAMPGATTIASSGAFTAAPADPVTYLRRRAELVSLQAEGRYPEMLPIAEQLVRDYACDGVLWRLLGEARFASGRPAEAAAAFERAMAISGPGTPSGPGYRLAVSHAAAGNKEAALAALERLVVEQGYLLPGDLYRNTAFADLRDEPRFLALVGRQHADGWNRDEGWRRDVAFLTAELRRAHPIYRNRPFPGEFIALRDALLRDIPTLSDEQVYVGLARLLSSLRQGHTVMVPFVPPRRLTFTRLPLQFYVFPEGVFIVDTGEGSRELLGARLVAIEGTPALEALRRINEVQTRQSGMELLWTGPTNLGIAQMLKGLGIATRTDRIEVTVRLGSGATVRRVLTTVPLGSRPKLVQPPGVAPPLFLRNVREHHWHERLPDGTLFVQVNQVQPDPDQSLAEYGLELRRLLRDQPTRNLIVDLRHNNGGNTFLYRELLRTLVAFSADERNRLYVIIGRGVYSAAANLATELGRLARPIFVGEPTSQTGNQYGDAANSVLPYSGLLANISGVIWQLSDPWDERPVTTPHMPVQLTAQAYFSGRDPALEAILSVIAAGGVGTMEMDPR